MFIIFNVRAVLIADFLKVFTSLEYLRFCFAAKANFGNGENGDNSQRGSRWCVRLYDPERHLARSWQWIQCGCCLCSYTILTKNIKDENCTSAWTIIEQTSIEELNRQRMGSSLRPVWNYREPVLKNKFSPRSKRQQAWGESRCQARRSHSPSQSPTLKNIILSK